MEQKEKKKLQLLKKLSYMEEFQVWRDDFVKPIIENLELEISEKSDVMDETLLRSNLKYLNSLKYFFDVIFKEADSNLNN